MLQKFPSKQFSSERIFVAPLASSCLPLKFEGGLVIANVQAIHQPARDDANDNNFQTDGSFFSDTIFFHLFIFNYSTTLVRPTQSCSFSNRCGGLWASCFARGLAAIGKRQRRGAQSKEWYEVEWRGAAPATKEEGLRVVRLIQIRKNPATTEYDRLSGGIFLLG